MNINQLSKLFSDMNTQEVRTLELKVGQVVRGVVTQQLPNQEALVNINGVQVKAKLEVPILEGQATLMQVAADSKGSFIHLKQVDPASLGLQDPMKDIIKSMQLPDKEWTNQLVRELRQEGFPLNRDTLQAFAQAAKALPANVDLESWMHAATLAFKRGMPMTLASISAMHQLSQGTPMHQLISQLQQQLTSLLQTQGQQLSSQSTQLLQNLTQSLNQLVQGQTEPSTGSQGQINSGQSQLISAQPAQVQTMAPSTLQSPLASFMKLLGVQHENMLSQQLFNKSDSTLLGRNQNQAQQLAQQQTSGQQTNIVNQSQHAVAAQQGQPQVQAQLGVISQVNNISPTLNSQTQSSSQAMNMTSGAQTSNQVAQPALGLQSSIAATPQAENIVNMPTSNSVVSSAGVQGQQPTTGQGQEQTIGNQAAANQNSSQQLASPAQTGAVLQQTGTQTLSSQQQNAATVVNNQSDSNSAQIATSQSNPAVNIGANQVTDSVKSTVLQLLQLADIPLAAKETMSQMLNHITGQQMMLSSERNHSMFTHITMYIPIKDNDGGQTAAIHVQTRRDRKGQLDSENCRIVFDLNMKRLGQTLVDMNVTNKIVSLNIWNDASYIQNLVESMRTEIYEAMQKTGYSLSSVKATPFKKDEAQLAEEVKAIVQPPDIQHMSATRYKGVDFKV